MKLIILILSISCISINSYSHRSKLRGGSPLSDVSLLYEESENLHMGYNNPLNEFNQPPVYDDYEPSEHVMVPKIMKKRRHRDIEHLTEQFTDEGERGFIDPTKNINDPHGILKFRFKEKTPERDQFHTLQPYYYSEDRPEKDSEAVRKEGLSNGVILEGAQRTCNFETAAYSDYFMDLRHDS